MKALHEEPGYMSADPLLHRDNLDQRPPEERESGALGSDQPESPKITLDREEASIYVHAIFVRFAVSFSHVQGVGPARIAGGRRELLYCRKMGGKLWIV